MMIFQCVNSTWNCSKHQHTHSNNNEKWTRLPTEQRDILLRRKYEKRKQITSCIRSLANESDVDELWQKSPVLNVSGNGKSIKAKQGAGAAKNETFSWIDNALQMEIKMMESSIAYRREHFEIDKNLCRQRKNAMWDKSQRNAKRIVI